MASHINKNTATESQNRGVTPTSSTAATPPPLQRVVPQSATAPTTSGVQTPTSRAPTTAAVPLDLLGQLFKALRPDLDVSQALAFLAQPIQPSTSAVPPEATPSSAQPIPPTTYETTGEAEATPDQEAEAAIPEGRGQAAEAAMAEGGEMAEEKEEREADPQSAENYVAGEEPEKAEPTGAEPEVVLKTPEEVQCEDDDVQMTTLQEVLAIPVPIPPVKEVEEAPSRGCPSGKRGS